MFWPLASEEGRADFAPSTPPPAWEATFDPPKASDATRARARARKELPDASVEDVIRRAEAIARYLRGQAA